ncbi:MAG TPA: glycosyltransferase family 2 protein [Anaerolineales bacterium]|nr:glycosyltransferase family 2 protein [Anaerolineales bacterium]
MQLLWVIKANCRRHSLQNGNLIPPLVSVVVLNFNAREMLATCIESLRRQTLADFEVIVVDNGSTDDSAAYVREHCPDCRLLSYTENMGFSKRNNDGIRVATGRYIALVSNDVTLDETWLCDLVAVAQQNERIGVVGGAQYHADERSRLVFSGGRVWRWLGSCLNDGSRANETKDVDWISGSAILFRREVIDKIGLWDEGYRAYFEDVDFCLRAKRAGFRVVYHPQAIAWHGVGRTFGKDPQRRRYEYESKFRFIFKNLSRSQIVAALFFQLIPVSIYNQFVLHDEDIRVKLLGFLAAIRSVYG